MKETTSITIGAVEKKRELYFNKQKAKHEKCFIKCEYNNRAIII